MKKTIILTVCLAMLLVAGISVQSNSITMYNDLPVVSTATVTSGCCLGIRGNVDNDPNDDIDIGDIDYLVNYLFHDGSEPACFEEADVDGNNQIGIGDLNYLIYYMFSGGPEPGPCQ